MANCAVKKSYLITFCTLEIQLDKTTSPDVNSYETAILNTSDFQTPRTIHTPLQLGLIFGRTICQLDTSLTKYLKIAQPFIQLSAPRQKLLPHSKEIRVKAVHQFDSWSLWLLFEQITLERVHHSEAARERGGEIRRD